MSKLRFLLAVSIINMFLFAAAGFAMTYIHFGFIVFSVATLYFHTKLIKKIHSYKDEETINQLPEEASQDI